jgi:hypothetical protein
MEADVDAIQSVGKNALGLQGTLEGYTNAMLGVRDELAAYVQGDTGNAIGGSMQTAYDQGRALNQKLQDVLNVLLETGVKIGADDLEQAAMVNQATSFGTNGAADVGTGNVAVNVRDWQ